MGNGLFGGFPAHLLALLRGIVDVEATKMPPGKEPGGSGIKQILAGSKPSLACWSCLRQARKPEIGYHRVTSGQTPSLFIRLILLSGVGIRMLSSAKT
jgi:hypothetical protein